MKISNASKTRSKTPCRRRPARVFPHWTIPNPWKQSFQLASILFAVLFFVAVQSALADDQALPVTVPHSQQFDLTAPNGKVYRIFIAEPKAPAPASGYAVLYVLDANAMFLTAVDAVRFQHGLIPTVVVGIGYPTDKTLDEDRRYYDYTPVTPPEHLLRSTTEPPVKPGGTGGQDQFLQFIQNTVKPEIQRRFNIDPARQAIFGHSLAGRFVLHVLFTHPELFHDYIAASPSIWWDNASILQEAKTFAAHRNPDSPPAGLLLTVGEMEQKFAPGTPKPRADFLTQARMVDRARELSELLKPLPLIRVSFTEFPDENHGSVVPTAISRAVRFALQPSR